MAQAVQTPADFQAIYRQLQKELTERVLQAELTQHLGYPEGAGRAADGNARNGTTPKRLLTDTGTLDLAIPPDRHRSFPPPFVPKGVRRLPVPEALHAVFPLTVIHQCVVHLVRQSLQFVSCQDLRTLVPLLRPSTRPRARAAPGPRWRTCPLRRWASAIRRSRRCGSAIESLNSQLGKPLRARGHFPTDNAATKLLYLALRNIQSTWTAKPAQQRRFALPHLNLLFGNRMPDVW